MRQGSLVFVVPECLVRHVWPVLRALDDANVEVSHRRLHRQGAPLGVALLGLGV